MGASSFFDEWSVYNQVLDHNYMHHDEIYRDVARILLDQYGNRPFALLDLGCGSARHIAQALQGRVLSRYVGYDLSDVALGHAAGNLSALGCPIELRRGDLLEAVTQSDEKFDVVFCSFALHHLTSSEKSVFFQAAGSRLNQHGMLLLIDTFRDEGEDRQLCLDRYCAWLRSTSKTLSADALDLLFTHIRSHDFPETTGVLGTMATAAGFVAPIEINRFRWHHTWVLKRVEV